MDNTSENQLNSHIVERMLILRQTVHLLLHDISIRFIYHMICYELYIINFDENTATIIFEFIMSTYRQFIDVKKTKYCLNEPLPNWLGLLIYSIKSKLIDHAKHMDIYNNEFIAVITELETFLPNEGVIGNWDLSNNQRTAIISRLRTEPAFGELYSEIFSEISFMASHA